MCNLAAYVGARPAAPLLLEMMERQEGFGGGYYSGLATISEGRLHHAKVVGDFPRLRRETAAESLPGTFGIAHGRSNSGGDVEWAHPFVTETESMAYVANGAMGFFTDESRQAEVMARLVAEGHEFRSASHDPVGYAAPPTLPDGAHVHLSEVMCHLIESFTADRPPERAMMAAYQTYPAEIVGLMIHLARPDCVIASRINQPLFIGRLDHGVVLATTALAFPPELTDGIWALPANTTAVVTADRIELLPFDAPPAPVPDFLAWGEAYHAVREALADGEPKTLTTLINAVVPYLDPTLPTQKGRITYEILDRLHRLGEVDFEQVRVPGARSDLDAPRRLSRKVVAVVPA